MRDRGKPCSHALSEDCDFKEVVVIGNGPSGMVISYMLSGNAPYLKEVPENSPIDDMLKVRLQQLGAGKCLLEVDLIDLAEGLEGRSQNPIPLLLDNLLRPGADLGYYLPPLIEWKFDVEKQIDHIILGRGEPGGSWRTFAPSVRSVSPSAWLTLPPHTSMPEHEPAERASAGDVADYYGMYVCQLGLQRHFRNGVVVTGVSMQPSFNVHCTHDICPLKARWCVTGYDGKEGRAFRYACNKVILASGTNDRPNPFPLPHSQLTYNMADVNEIYNSNLIRRDLPVLVVGSGLSAADAIIKCRSNNIKVAHLYRNTANVLDTLPRHVYPEYWQVSKMMAEGLKGNYDNYTPFPEYTIVEVNECDVSNTSDKKFSVKTVKLLNLKTNDITEIKVTLIIVLIGSKPDLHYLPGNFDLTYVNINVDKCDKCNQKRKNSLKTRWDSLKSVLNQRFSKYWDFTGDVNGNNAKKCDLEDCNSVSDAKCTCNLSNPYSSGLGFGVEPTKPIDSRKNPILIDKSTHEVVNSPQGLYALGPLTSDNFVRFISGGAVAIVAHIWNDGKEPEG